MANEKSKQEPAVVKILLKKVIKEKEISIRSLAKKSNVERKSIYNILNGESEPKICTLVKLAKALNVGLDELVKY
jgi:transcriptional regulator with XRE-family HTH domain